MDNTAAFEDLVRELDQFEQDAKTLKERIGRLMDDARQTFVDDASADAGDGNNGHLADSSGAGNAD